MAEELIDSQIFPATLPSCINNTLPFAIYKGLSELKSQCRKISKISNQFLKFEFWLIPPKQPFRCTISRNDIKKSSSALHFEKFGKVQKFHKNTFFYSRNCCKFQQFSRKQYKRTKAPIDLMLYMHLPVSQSFETALKCLAK